MTDTAGYLRSAPAQRAPRGRRRRKNVAAMKSQNEPSTIAKRPAARRARHPIPTMNVARRPNRRAMAPTGRAHAAIPTKMEIGRVA